uniref:Uncharacterized protein n=1 Tax=Schistocephalus solidus TaxID=70667 RepID=A0A0X3Q3T3_SCHSO
MPRTPEPVAKSTSAATSLLDQLSSLKPQFSGADLLSEEAKQAESAGAPSTAATASGWARPAPSTLRRGRRQRGQARGGRLRRGGDNSRLEGRGARRGNRRRGGGGVTTETAAKQEEEDEEGASGVAAVFASHPVVRMASKRRECMRNAALMAKRPTLLQMLLAEDMRHERNQLMQCVRFVVRNKFFR